jgi:hypothetical protein
MFSCTSFILVFLLQSISVIQFFTLFLPQEISRLSALLSTMGNYLKIYKENFNVSSEGPSSGGSLSARRAFARNSPYIFSGNCIPTNKSLFILLALPTLAGTVCTDSSRLYHFINIIHFKLKDTLLSPIFTS